MKFSQQASIGVNVLLALVVIWLILSLSKARRADQLILDYQERQIDSISRLYKLAGDSVVNLKKQKASLIDSLNKGHEVVKIKKNEIRNFTPDSRARWADSVLKVAGYR